LYDRLVGFKRKKEEKLQEQRRLIEFQKEMEMFEVSRQSRFSGEQSEKKGGAFQMRMQVDIERRNFEKETKAKIRKIEAEKKRQVMFHPKINKRSKSRTSEKSVYERMQEDVERRHS